MSSSGSKATAFSTRRFQHRAVFSIQLCRHTVPFLATVALLMSAANLAGSPGSVAAAAASAAGGVEGGHCPQWVNDQIQQCVQPVAEFAKTLNRQQTEYSSPVPPSSAGFGQALQWPTKMGGQVFRELCRLISDFELCVDAYREKCPRHITISLIEASYGFLCNEGYQTFMSSAECLMELDQRPSVRRCHDRTLRDIEEANNDQSGVIANKLDKMCNALNFFSDCVSSPIRQSCGREAWHVIFRVLKDTTRTLMPMCHFEGEEGEEEDSEEDEGKREAPRQNSSSPGHKLETKEGPPPQAKTTTESPPPLPGGWEEWGDDAAGNGRDVAEGGDSDEFPLSAPSSHQIHYGSQTQQYSGERRAGSWKFARWFTLFPLTICTTMKMYYFNFFSQIL